MKIGLFAINYGICADRNWRSGWPGTRRQPGSSLDLPETRRYVGALRQLAREYERPAELGRLELSVTPAGPADKAAVERYAELGVDRLVLLPQPDAGPSRRHAPVPVDRILRNIDAVAERIIAP